MRIYIFFWTKKLLPRSPLCIHCFLYHKAQLNNRVQLLCQVLSSFPCTRKTSISCDKSIGESPCQCQETCEKGLGELDLSSLRRVSFGDLEWCHCLWEGCCNGRASLLLVRWSRGRMQVWKQGRCRETIRKSFLILGSWAGYQGYWVLNYYAKIKTE